MRLCKGFVVFEALLLLSVFSHWNHLNSEHDHHQMVLDDQSDG